MRPTLAAEELRRSLTQYLTTTFALADPPVREALERFLTDPEQGIFRGPYLRIRTPFRPAEEGWRDVLGWAPPGFTPYLHQARAFRRLSTLGKAAEPTLITTGTGSGKTESFLVPVLDHCRRARAAGRAGVKAVLLYPMNALATDQAHRINELLQQDELHDVTAGLYIGDTPEVAYRKVMTQRAEIRRNPPDLLITNYKMLDLLLQRVDDLPLWQDAGLAYVVVDEFHTYDGAQGTDVAMLLRRLAAATGHSRPGRPLGDICPVATSATLGENGTAAPGEDDGGLLIRQVAARVFGTDFPAASVVGEDRLTAEEFVGDIDVSLPLPGPDELYACGDPLRDPAAMARVAAAVTGQDGLGPAELGAVLRRHILTQAVLDLLGDGPRTPQEMLELLPRRGAYNWGAYIRDNPARAATALARFVALLSHARDPEDERRPFLLVETHVWVRAVSRLLRLAHHTPAFAWIGEPPVVDADSAFDVLGRTMLPAIYCRHCGRSGWAAYSPERDPAELVTTPEKIYRAAVGNERKRVRPLILATPGEVEAADPNLAVLDGERVRPYDPAADTYGEGDAVFVLTDLATTREADNAAAQDRCPACAMDQGIRFLGAGLASLASVAITQLFAGDQLPAGQRKTLLFNDSVQDAAHRAGFVANRSYTFSLRRLLTSRLDPETPILLNDLIADLAAAASEAGVLPAVVPPDLHDRGEIDAILAGETTGTAESWRLIGERLAFAAVLEFGLRSRQGRTLEMTRTAAAEVLLADPWKIAELARDAHTATSGMIEPQAAERYLVLVRGLLERLRYRGAIKHAWLDRWLGNAGTSRYNAIWGRRPDGMPAFPRGLSAPAFMIDRPKKNSEFDRIDADQAWTQDWATRCLRLNRGQAGEYLSRLLPMLADEGVIARRTADDAATAVYGLQPGHVQVRLLADAHADEAGIGCDRCAWEQTLPPEQVAAWFGQPCPRYRCGGRLTDRGTQNRRADYYRRLYLGEGVFRVVTAEHTGALSRRQRELVEQRFRAGDRYTDPNVLSCTPTLELGIDIGDLSAVILASLPPGPANYVQRAGRAGRRTGNALLVTMVGGSPRDRYFLDEPRDMIAGDIVPPGGYLSAVEILRRQYVAHLVDLCTRGRFPAVLPLPRRASALFGEAGWLAGFVPAALADGAALATGFLALFGASVSPEAAADLRAFATAGLAGAARRAEQVWERRLADLRDRLAVIDTAVEALVEADPEQERIKRSLVAERRAVARLLGETGRGSAQAALVELGLLPNYSLLDSATSLEATITWEEEVPGGKRYHSEVREYQRPARLALTELAPGNSFYVRGYRHEVTGLDAGTPSRPAFEDWRVCPDCGHVRTFHAKDDTAPCPRCGGTDIGEVSSLHQVLRPVRVTAHDRRDDAQIRDDNDDRLRRYYETAVAVDVDPAGIAAGSWRHATEVFGVDFTRDAAVRRFNLGAARQDRPAETRFAGLEVRPNPFHTCPSCGGTTVDGPPSAGEGDGLVATSSYDQSRRHHRPWCPFRRAARDTEHVKLILAHELRTEALRILLPVATLLAEERTASFQAALMAGIAARYGGDPDHLAIVTATMPDQETRRRRRFLVLHDTLPGGTGYLHRLASPEGFHEVLAEAFRIVAGCRCKEERGRRACHRCLLAHVPGSMYDRVSRADALEMLGDLLADWRITPVRTTGDISLWDQIESELEARFLSGLEAWARRPDTPGTLARGEVVNGRRTADLRVEGPDGLVRHWRLTLQNTIRGTRPDLLFDLVDPEPQQVAVYLDGYAYHASPQVNRLAGDAGKRARLRAHRGLVFQLTWDDLDEWEARDFAPGDAKAPSRAPYLNNAQMVARDYYSRTTGRDPGELNLTMWGNPVETLLAYLAEPDPLVWLRRTEAVCAGVLPVATAGSRCEPAGVPERVTAALRGDRLPPGPAGSVMVCTAADLAGCPLTLVVAGRAWSAFTVVDDRDETIRAGETAHRRRWAGWLYWGNLLQLLDAGAGDGGQLARTGLDDFDTARLAAAGGDGFRTMLSLLPLDDDLTDPGDATPVVPRPVIEPVPPVDPAPVDQEAGLPGDWEQVLDLLDPDEPGLAAFARALAEQGVPAPEVGYELGEQAWQAELAWPAAKVAIVLAGDDHEAHRRDAAYGAAGWEVRIAPDWTAESLAGRIGPVK
ncbi:DEAD/DEAH box helicase [Sphaerisporangium rufum]|uniref:DEAD/DEAH box helicase n=1 Tax=Sphaerisporangium rufum TaxID=1381558 RepID=A0A919R2A4_9ACTN|nr:DEAD/DEAH box helicase [Sphaerisporangium rufum]GII75682.1 DEAD/DEAH box helicase [Sphaerisporangium rufum]